MNKIMMIDGRTYHNKKMYQKALQLSELKKLIDERSKWQLEGLFDGKIARSKDMADYIEDLPKKYQYELLRYYVMEYLL